MYRGRAISAWGTSTRPGPAAELEPELYLEASAPGAVVTVVGREENKHRLVCVAHTCGFVWFQSDMSQTSLSKRKEGETTDLPFSQRLAATEGGNQTGESQGELPLCAGPHHFTAMGGD